jgi:hypothetical protein
MASEAEETFLYMSDEPPTIFHRWSDLTTELKRRGTNVFRLSTIKLAICLVLERAALQHITFQLNQSEVLRLNGTPQALKEAGKISRAPLVKRVPLGILLTRQLVLGIIWQGS